MKPFYPHNGQHTENVMVGNKKKKMQGFPEFSIKICVWMTLKA